MPPARFYELRSTDASASFTNFTPTAPGPGDVFAAGGNCTIQWAVDQSGSWNNVTIDLMSGSNNNMSFVANVASGLDGTDASNTPFNWTCPEVDPYSDIYFYQFTNGEDKMDAKWTTRFTISSSSGEVDPPANPTQPDGSQIPWGVGHVSNSTSQASNATTQSVAAPEDDDYFNSLQASKKGSEHSGDKSSKEHDEEEEDSARRQKHSDDDSKSKHEKADSKSKSAEKDEEDDDRHSDEDAKHSEKASKKGSSSDSDNDDDDERHTKSSKADDKKHSDDDEGDEKHSGDDGDEEHSSGDDKHTTHKADDDDDEPETHSAKTKSTQQDNSDDEPSASSYSSAEADSGSRGRPAGAGQSPLTMSLPPSAKSGSVDTIVHSDSPYVASDRASNSAEVPSLPVTVLLFSYTLLFLVLL
ncbi:uncharacterized protein SCHCODRAFT_02677580 [Schizophyllum commune H4-8]|uniref:Yeast cell wall synthesis Kre9/Knh1-like N-terminal domain-containing protein n=1 Tax=Schizophyllum commune (strain H4-8 / FGSC 9210) TaxID=578458 RepID=D8PQ12_SCHCM|nr:uncharacterized protein SCHCODRAFT_02677580 [Schizophyllum commune H4-8]KAI5893531.1 hypothetical protein SCHCODRAFT_02677580 [Schizophyllum commune H4-8]